MTDKEFQVATGLSIETCITCGTLFSIPLRFQAERRKDHRLFFCPNGHSQYYPAKSDLEMARDEAKRAQVEVDQLKCCVAINRNIIRSKDYQVRHYKGELTKLKKKVAP